MLDAKRRVARAWRTIRNLTFGQWVLIALIAGVLLGLFGGACAVWSDARRETQQTRRDEQHDANVSADIQAANDNQARADAHEADRREADGRYQESERAVDRARARAAQARARDEEVTRHHEETRRTSTTGMPDIDDDDVCAKLRSVNISAVGCREK